MSVWRRRQAYKGRHLEKCARAIKDPKYPLEKKKRKKRKEKKRGLPWFCSLHVSPLSQT